MKVDLQEFTIKVVTKLVTPASANYRPPSWPPPRDWPVSIDKNGVVVSRWGDSRWDLSPWAETKMSLCFGDGEKGIFDKAEPLRAENADLLRMIATWFIWGPRCYRTATYVKAHFSHIRQIIALCNREKISAARLMNFPKVFDVVSQVIAPSKFTEMVSLLHRLYDSRDTLGFVLVDPVGLRQLVAEAPDHDGVQTPYIPPRIWMHHVERLRACVMDFLAHQEQIEACFQFCLDAYIKNHGSLAAALTPDKDQLRNPFGADCRRIRGCMYLGNFSEIATSFGIADVLRKWVAWEHEAMQVRNLSAYMSIVTYAGLAYIANFTLQRKEEVASLRTSCLRWENDELLGPVPIICGETTKTDLDSDARWVASPSVDVAIKAVSAIARLRMAVDRENPLIHPSAEDQIDPYLWSSATEPWGQSVGRPQPYEIRKPLVDLRKAMDRYPLLFDRKQLEITQEDLKVARRLTPNLSTNEFTIGEAWPLAWHQYRRTGAVNMFASGDISNSTMQQQMKHSTHLMPLYYGRNHGHLQLNEKVRAAIVTEMYSAQAELLKRVVCTDRYVSPHSPERKKVLVESVLSVKEFKDLIKLAKKGAIAFREHRLGGCMKAGVCEYSGIESVARCAGGDGGKPCTDVLYDRAKEPQIRADLRRVTEELKFLPAGQPRYDALVEERVAMENYLNAISAD